MAATSGLGVYNNTVDTVVRALLERYFMVKTPEGFRRPLVPDNEIFIQPLFNEYAKSVADLTRASATVLSDAETAALYTGPKRRIYEAAARSLANTPVNLKDAKIKQFPKFEKQDLGKAPRIINPRTPRYNLSLGCYLKKLEKPLYEAINETFGARTRHTVVKGLNCYDAASVIKDKWDLFKDPVAVGIDATKWDAHVSAPALLFEHSIYLDIFDQDKELKKLLKWQTQNRGKAYCDDGTVEFIIQATRASGDINTSMGNCLIACALIWVYLRSKGIVAEVCNNGDDTMVILERSDLREFMNGFDEQFRRFGFRMEVENPVDHFENLEFCQTRPVFDGVRWRLMRNPLACLKKDAMCLVAAPNAKALAKWYYAVGECGLAIASGLPILQSWYSLFYRSGRPCSAKFKHYLFQRTVYHDMGKGCKVNITPVHDEARASFAQATGIGPELQIAYEQLFDQMHLSSEIVDMPGMVHYTNQSVPILEQALSIFDNSNDRLFFGDPLTSPPTNDAS